MSRSMANQAEAEALWAERVSRALLEPLRERWQHTCRVVDRTRSFSGVMPADELEVLSAAAYVHDIGYSPKLVKTGFHPLDGARFARDAGHDRLARLIAHHSASTTEAEERHLSAELAEFPEEDSLVARA